MKERPVKLEKKVWNIIRIMERLAAGETLYPQDVELQEALEIEGGKEARERKLRRYLNEIHAYYSQIVRTEKIKIPDLSRRPIEGYRVPNKERDVHDALKFFLRYDEDLDWLLQMIHENDPSLLTDLNDEYREHLEKVIEEDKAIYHFVGSPFERLSEGALRSHMNQLKKAVKFHEYRRIVHRHKGESRSDDVACLKLIFTDGNWYLAAERIDETLSDEERFLLIRLAFIHSIGYVRDESGHPDERYVEYSPTLLEKYRDFFSRIQNAMTLYHPFETATILASPAIASYFRQGMKPFFPSQRFVKERSDGSVEFTLDYTQPMEILPFIKRWAPDLTILSPQPLRDEMRNAIQTALDRH